MLRAFIIVMPMNPPMIPPTACNPAQPNTPPHCVKADGAMKIVPITKPAKAADATEMINRIIEPITLFSNSRLCPLTNARTSNTTDAAKNPKKWRAVGRTIMLMIRAINPTNVAVPIFLDHQTARIKAEKPIRSQAKGKWNT